MEFDTNVKSPLTGGKCKLVVAMQEEEFRGEKFMVHVVYYICQDTGEEFTIGQQDPAIDDLYSQYRIKHGIPFPEEIRAIRQHYGLSYQEISRLLGFGINQYSNYEKGQVPSLSNGIMIASLKNKEFAIALAKNQCPELFNKIIEASEYNLSDNPIESILYPLKEPTVFNGFSFPQLRKAKEMVRYLLQKMGPTSPTRLNKAMFYSEFTSYRDQGKAISGLRYEVLPFGPCPANYSLLYDNISGVKCESSWTNGKETKKYFIEYDAPSKTLSENDKAALDRTIIRISPFTTQALVEESHKEPSWYLHQLYDTIPYSDSYTLRLV